MKVGMNILLWTDQPTAKQHNPLLTKIKQWGFDGVEFQIAPMSAADIREMGQHCDDLGLGRTAILALDAAEADPANADKRLRDAAVEQIKSAVDKTRAIGADLLVGPMFQGLGRFSGSAPTEQELDWSAETLRKAGEYAQSQGVRLALEPINRFEMYIANTVAQGAHICEMIGLPNVGLLVDTHHGNIEEADTAAAWKRYAKHVFHVHISENNRGIPGKGQAVRPGVFQVLKEIGYDGWLTIEAFNRSVPGLIPRLHLWRNFADRDEDIAVMGHDFIRRNIQ